MHLQIQALELERSPRISTPLSQNPPTSASDQFDVSHKIGFQNSMWIPISMLLSPLQQLSSGRMRYGVYCCNANWCEGMYSSLSIEV